MKGLILTVKVQYADHTREEFEFRHVVNVHRVEDLWYVIQDDETHHIIIGSFIKSLSAVPELD
jgi:hypothetical protein